MDTDYAIQMNCNLALQNRFFLTQALSYAFCPMSMATY